MTWICSKSNDTSKSNITLAKQAQMTKSPHLSTQVPKYTKGNRNYCIKWKHNRSNKHSKSNSVQILIPLISPAKWRTYPDGGRSSKGFLLGFLKNGVLPVFLCSPWGLSWIIPEVHLSGEECSAHSRLHVGIIGQPRVTMASCTLTLPGVSPSFHL